MVSDRMKSWASAALSICFYQSRRAVIMLCFWMQLKALHYVAFKFANLHKTLLSQMTNLYRAIDLLDGMEVWKIPICTDPGSLVHMEKIGVSMGLNAAQLNVALSGHHVLLELGAMTKTRQYQCCRQFWCPTPKACCQHQWTVGFHLPVQKNRSMESWREYSGSLSE